MTSEATEAFFDEARKTYHRALDACYNGAPEWHGKTFAANTEEARKILSIPMSFSRTLIDLAGGMQKLRDYWRIEEDRGVYPGIAHMLEAK